MDYNQIYMATYFTSQNIVYLLDTYRYWVILPIVIVEGPIITIAAGVMASLGYLNFFLAYTLIVIGDLIGDSIYYCLGRFGGKSIVPSITKLAGISSKRISQIKQHFNTHARKTLIFGKLTHAIGPVFLISAGIVKMPFGEFILFNFIPTLPKSLILILVGYYFGAVYTSANSYLHKLTWITLGFVAVVAIVYYIRKKNK